MVVREPKEDRYLHSELFIELVKKQGENFMKTIADDIASIARNVLVFCPGDSKSTMITDKDIAFILKLNEDRSDWIPVRRSKVNEKEK